MQNIIFTLQMTGGAAKDYYIPVPCRGRVNSFRVAYSAITDADELFTLFWGTSAVSVCTPTDALAAGTVIDGAMNATYKDTIFDPASATATYKVFHIDNVIGLDTSGVLTVFIEFDESAAVTQAALEA